MQLTEQKNRGFTSAMFLAIAAMNSAKENIFPYINHTSNGKFSSVDLFTQFSKVD